MWMAEHLLGCGLDDLGGTLYQVQRMFAEDSAANPFDRIDGAPTAARFRAARAPAAVKLPDAVSATSVDDSGSGPAEPRGASDARRHTGGADSIASARPSPPRDARQAFVQHDRLAYRVRHEEFEALTAEARELEKSIAKNTTEIVEA
jgi:hypothetical protein